jgi:hypothetical protein
MKLLKVFKNMTELYLKFVSQTTPTNKIIKYCFKNRTLKVVEVILRRQRR